MVDLLWTGLAITRVSSLVAGRSWQGLPDECPIRRGMVGNVFRLGDVSAMGTVATSFVCALDTKHVDKVIFKVLTGHRTGGGRWKGTSQSYHVMFLVKHYMVLFSWSSDGLEDDVIIDLVEYVKGKLHCYDTGGTKFLLDDAGPSSDAERIVSVIKLPLLP